MKVVKGSWRTVIVLEKFAIKIPKINITIALKIACYEIRYGVFWKNLFDYSYEMYGSVHIHLFKGIMANWLEYQYYRETKSSFLVPTHFSLCGLVNIQKRADALKMNDDFWSQMYRLTNGEVFDDSHHFAEPANFSKTNGQLQMIDYGSKRCHNVIRKYGEKIQYEFNFSI